MRSKSWWGVLSSRRWRVARWSLAVVFVVAGVVAFLVVKATVVGLAAVISIVFILRGALGVAASLQASITTLLTWVAAGTLVHGIGQITSAFVVRKVGRHLAARRA